MKTKRIFLMLAAAAMVSGLMACPSAVGKCKDDLEKACEWEEKCGDKRKKDDCIKATEKEYCDEKTWEAYEKACDTAKGTMEDKDRCSDLMDISKCTRKSCNIGQSCSKDTDDD
jgi:hypothetical protein